MFMWMIPATQAEKMGCTLIESALPLKALNYKELAERCLSGDGGVLFSAQFNENYAYITCMADGENSKWCKHGLQNLIARRVTTYDIIGEYIEPVKNLWDILVKAYGHANHYNIDQVVVAALAVAYAADIKRAAVTTAVHAVSFFTGAKVFPLVMVLHYLPLLSGVFVAATLIAPSYYGFLIAVVHYLALLIDASLPRPQEQTTLMQRVAGASMAGGVFVIWQVTEQALRMIAVPLSVQVLVFLTALVVNAGVSMACAQVTITNPDGTVTKYKRYTQVKRTIADGMTALVQKAKAVRGVLPAFPVHTDAIAIVEAETPDGPVQGTAFRLGNYILTAGHVVRDATKIRLTWGKLTVDAVVEGIIELPLFTDTIVRLRVPKAFALMKSLKLAREPENDYYQLISFGQNGEPVTFSGWGTLDAPYFSAPFATHGGTSGSPIIDRTGKVVAMHFGSNLACSSGYMLTDLMKTEPVVKKQNDISDEVMEKLMNGVRNSTAGVMAKVEDLTFRVRNLEAEADDAVRRDRENAKRIQDVEGKLEEVCNNLLRRLEGIDCGNTKRIQNVENKLEDACKGLIRRLDGIEGLLTNLKETYVEQAKKPKKNKAREHIRRKLGKTRMLTEEEYKRLQDEGYTADEIKAVVNNLRQSAFLDWEMEHESDWDESPDLDEEYQPVEEQKARLKVHVETENKQKTLDIQYPDGEEEQARKDLREIVKDEPVPDGESHVVVYDEEQKARLKVHVETENKQKTLDIQYPDGEEEQARKDLREIVKDEPVPDGESHVVVYYDDEGAIYFDDKKVSLKKIKLEGSTRFQKSKETYIGGTAQAPKISKISTTTKEVIEGEKNEPCEENAPEEQPKKDEVAEEQRRSGARMDQRARVKCTVCGAEMSLNKAPKHKCPKNGKGAPSGAQ
nr:MAG: nonstructural polyprotein [Astroviridae sp.]